MWFILEYSHLKDPKQIIVIKYSSILVYQFAVINPITTLNDNITDKSWQNHLIFIKRDELLLITQLLHPV